MALPPSRPWLSAYPTGVPADVPSPTQPVHALLEQAAELYADRPALDFFGSRATYAELWDQVLQAAEGLSRRGVGPGSVVAIALPNCPQHVVAFHAVLRLGGIVVEHNPTYGPEQFAAQLADCGASHVIAWDKVVPAVAQVIDRQVTDLLSVDMTRALPLLQRTALRLPLAKARRLREEMTGGPTDGVDRWEDLTRDGRKLPPSTPGPVVDDVALIQYTGGTTGTPKGAVLTHSNLVANATQSVAWVPGMRAGHEVFYGALPFFHAFGLTLCLTVPVLLGSLVVVMPKFSVSMFLAAQRRIPGTFFAGVPPMFDRIATAVLGPEDKPAAPAPTAESDAPRAGSGPDWERRAIRSDDGDQSVGAAKTSGAADETGTSSAADGGPASSGHDDSGSNGSIAAATTRTAATDSHHTASPTRRRRPPRRKADLTSFRRSISGAMSLPPEVAERWERVSGGILVEGYGLTETSPISIGNPVSAARQPGTLGLPFPSTEIRIVDPENPTQDVPEGESGELLIRGPQVFQGYWNQPEETAACLLEGGWFRTGDVVVRGPDGFIRLVDRIKEIIIIGGFNVYPSQVERHLAQMPQIKDVAVVGVPHKDLGERVVAAVVLAAGAKLDLVQARAWCANRLARYSIPKQIVLMTELPRSQVGKVLRRAVRNQILRMHPPGQA